MINSKLILGLVVVIVVGGGWWAWHSQSGSNLANISGSDTKLTDSQVQQLIDRVSKFMVVPADEKPSVAIIRDVATLAAQQSFYKDAKDGDVLIVYTSRAIIYDPKADKLVNVGPIQRTDSPAPVASGSATVSPSVSPSGTPGIPEKVTVEVRNGTSTAGLAGTMASTLKKNAWVTISTVGDSKGSYTATVLVDLSKGKKPNAVAAVAKILGVSAVTALPSGEKASTADILVIVGK